MRHRFVDWILDLARGSRFGIRRLRRAELSDADLHFLIRKLHAMETVEREPWLRARVADSALRQPLLAAVANASTESLPRVVLPPSQIDSSDIPPRFGRYEPRRILGRGGSGIVYEAWDPSLDRTIALKVLSPEFDTPDYRRRFEQEWKATGRFSHPNIVTIYDTQVHEGRPFIAMEFVEGTTIADIIFAEIATTKVRPLLRKLEIIDAICAGVAATHEKGLVHRDIKPANIMVSDRGAVKVLDFGIAKSVHPADDALRAPATGKHIIVGTVGYIAPERLAGTPADTASDIFAVAVVGYEFLTGYKPFGDTESDIMRRTRRGEVAPFSVLGGESAKDVEAIVLKGLALDPGARFADMSEMQEAFAAARRARAARSAQARRRARMPVALVALLTSMAGLFAVVGNRWFPRRTAPAERAFVSVLVADFDNRTGDPLFDGALEQPLVISMEGAPFVRAYPRPDARRLASQINSGRLDRSTAQLIARREGITYVLAGSITANGNDVILQVDAIEPSGGTAPRTARAVARGKAQVANAFSDLAGQVRAGLGDTSPPDHAETFTAGSLAAMKEYEIAQDMAKSGNDEGAVAHYRAAIDADAQFGRAYSGLAVSTQRLGRIEDAEAAWSKAVSLIGRMSERERYRTLGAYYLGSTHDYQKAVETYTALVEKYPGDSAGFGNLALSRFYLRDFAKALAEGRRGVAIDSKNVFQRNNLALYAMYAGDFSSGAAEAKRVIADNRGLETAYLPIVMDAVSRGDLTAAAATYVQMAEGGAAGASLASIGIADLAMYRGQFDAAVAELERGIEHDRAAKNSGGVALKQIALAEAHAARKTTGQTVKDVRAALSRSRRLLSVAVPAARLLAHAGEIAEARRLAAELDAQLSNQYHAYSKIILAEIGLSMQKYDEATRLLDDAIGKADLWLARFDRSVAYVNTRHYAEAISELEACEKRRGEVTALFFDDVPTVRYLAPLRYWKGRAYEGLASKDVARDEYEGYLSLRSEAAADPLVVDARRRLLLLR